MSQQTDRREGGAGTDTHVLDNAVRAALTGPHAHLAERGETGVPPAEGWESLGRAARCQDGIHAFAALAHPADPVAPDDLRALVGPGTTVRVKPVDRVPGGRRAEGGGEGAQLADTALCAEPAPDAVRLGPADVPEMLGLVARTRPGPFLKRTVEMGTPLGAAARASSRSGVRKDASRFAAREQPASAARCES
ncbi:hypothetical protein SRB17_16790 [Streptomyces sp. RB17]|uniref:hypothetical protein n=1 Tax=Streptomyces sp. RB17 TaxID=2585197 RepID=UPI0013092DF8|nr:hypothetical protein [Streptomyces sp. RB17]MQY33714.1 hypothetical protein [Streptomyces sp. RB17]